MNVIFPLPLLILALLLILLPSPTCSSLPPLYPDPHPSREVKICALYMVRDESLNIRTNLPLWGSLFSGYVFAVDSRTVDDTILAIAESVPPGSPRHVFGYRFDGFGNSRTEVFGEAYRTMPWCSHVMVIDPDWQPLQSEFDTEPLRDGSKSGYQFKIWDRSGITTRNCNWLMRHVEGLYFDYYVHEFLRFPDGGPYHEDLVLLDWEVAEVESTQSWHQTVGHNENKAVTKSASRSYKRFLFDISLLEREQKDERYRNSQHTLYYLGVAHCALVEASPDYYSPAVNPGIKMSGENRKLAETCVKHLEKMVALYPVTNSTVLGELTWSGLRWLGYNYQFLLDDFAQSERFYKACIEFDVHRVDCKIELSKLYTNHHHPELAYAYALESLKTTWSDRAFSSNFYIFDCVVPVQVQRAVYNVLRDRAGAVFDGHDEVTFAMGSFMGEKARNNCVNGLILENPDILRIMDEHYGELYSSSHGGRAFKCARKDDTKLESQLLEKSEGWHYFCGDDQPASASDGSLSLVIESDVYEFVKPEKSYDDLYSFFGERSRVRPRRITENTKIVVAKNDARRSLLNIEKLIYAKKEEDRREQVEVGAYDGDLKVDSIGMKGKRGGFVIFDEVLGVHLPVGIMDDIIITELLHGRNGGEDVVVKDLWKIASNKLNRLAGYLAGEEGALTFEKFVGVTNDFLQVYGEDGGVGFVELKQEVV